jgi:hypothetical protein
MNCKTLTLTSLLEAIIGAEKLPPTPFIPVVRPPDMELGIIWQHHPLTIWKTTLAEMPKTAEEFTTLPNVTYRSLPALINDGWEMGW